MPLMRMITTIIDWANVVITGGTMDNVLQGNVKFDHNVETLAANKTLVITDKVIQKLDLDGIDRDVLLPAEGDSTDLVFFIYNMGGEVGEDLYIQDDAAGALETIGYNQMGLCTCDGTTWKVICVTCGDGVDTLNLRVKEENTSALVIGQPVYISGATGAAFPNVGLADCSDSTKIRIKGLVAEAISQNSTGYIRIQGLLENVDSTKGNAVNPNSQDWTAGDELWVAATAGGLTNVRPTSGRTIKVGTALTVEGSDSKILVDVRENPVFASAASGEDLVLRMGDSAGANKISGKDYGNNEVFAFDSNGKLIITGIKENITSHSATEAVTAATMYGNIHKVTGAYTLTLPAAVIGMSAIFRATAAAVFSIKAGTSCHFEMIDGTVLDNGDKQTSGGTKNAWLHIHCETANVWITSGQHGTMEDGGV